MAKKHHGNKKVRSVQPSIGHEEIAGLAKQIWEREGRQTGRDLEYWLQAEQQLRAANAAATPPANSGVEAATHCN